ITVSEIKLFSEFTLNNFTESYIIMLINRENNIIIALFIKKFINRVKNEREKNLTLIDIFTINIITVNIIIVNIEDITERAELLKLTDITEFNLTFLTIIEAAAAS
ncbi:hypothetical protein EMPG_11203, partial [Blastomyces silverae]